ncbi:hypothetical protein HPC38_01680 [Pasteurellaceae bacterium HPA106]|uniref:hypothetical protein n=1 Tax=Spirabiliibacterium pneumoniae TaxID=221400 RepID=UPI001AAD3D98|nr:hypothetical protein [Spirabiliibacterium pneumoniae]MBE2895586.1 hypothetical protein [Spirabiliibacterium pneumoniae]
MKNFYLDLDLEKALAGEPVKLKNGDKAFVKYVIPEQYKTSAPLRGFIVADHSVLSAEWLLNGKDKGGFSGFDIVGMWEEPNRIINDVGVPPCVTEETWADDKTYYLVNLLGDCCYCCGLLKKNCRDDEAIVQRGLAFETKAGAQAMAKALLNYMVEDI